MLGTHRTWDAGYSVDRTCSCDTEQGEWSDAWRELLQQEAWLELLLEQQVLSFVKPGNKGKPKVPSRENRTSSSMGQRAGSAVGAVLDTKNKFKDKANAVKENIKDMPTQTAYAVHSAKEKAKSSVSDFKRGMVQEQQNRQSGRMEKQEQHRKNIADKRMELQKAQEARQTQRKADGSATAGTIRTHERPATASTTSKASADKMQDSKRPATVPTSKASEPVKAKIAKERPLASGADKKTSEPALQKHGTRLNGVEVNRQTARKERKIKKATINTTEKKGRKK